LVVLGLATILSGSQIDDLESGVVVEAQIRVTADIWDRGAPPRSGSVRTSAASARKSALERHSL